MRSRADGLTGFAVLHLAAAAVSSAFGAAGRSGSLAAPVADLFWNDVHRIFLNNVRALVVLIVAGVVFAGVAGIVIFAVNGYLFGHMLVISEAPMAWVWLYAPLELASFALGGAASMRAGLEVIAWLRRDIGIGPSSIGRFAFATGLALAGLAASALLEGIAIQRAWGGGPNP